MNIGCAPPPQIKVLHTASVYNKKAPKHPYFAHPFGHIPVFSHFPDL